MSTSSFPPNRTAWVSDEACRKVETTSSTRTLTHLQLFVWPLRAQSAPSSGCIRFYWISISMVFLNKTILPAEEQKLNAQLFITCYQCVYTIFTYYFLRTMRNPTFRDFSLNLNEGCLPQDFWALQRNNAICTLYSCTLKCSTYCKSLSFNILELFTF